MEISKINLNGVEYDIISQEQREQISELQYQLNKINEPYIASTAPEFIKSQNHIQTRKAKELKEWTAPDYPLFWYSAKATTLYTQYGNIINSNSKHTFVLDSFKGDYITTDEDDIVTLYYGCSGD